jgi:hypothetical protein
MRHLRKIEKRGGIRNETIRIKLGVICLKGMIELAQLR